jgi:hypothetical protein
MVGQVEKIVGGLIKLSQIFNRYIMQYEIAATLLDNVAQRWGWGRHSNSDCILRGVLVKGVGLIPREVIGDDVGSGDT